MSLTQLQEAITGEPDRVEEVQTHQRTLNSLWACKVKECYREDDRKNKGYDLRWFALAAVKIFFFSKKIEEASRYMAWQDEKKMTRHIT